MAAGETKKFQFDKFATPDISGVSNPAFIDLATRLGALTFMVSELSNSEICGLLTQIAALKPYYRGIIEQFLVQRMNAAGLGAWQRFKDSKFANALAFYAKYFNQKNILGFESLNILKSDVHACYEEAHARGERYHSSLALGLALSGEYVEEIRKDESPPFLSKQLTLLREASDAGNLTANIILIGYLRFEKNVPAVINLMSKRLVLGPRFYAGKSDSEELLQNLEYTTDICEFVPCDEKLLDVASMAFISTEGQISSNVLTRSYYTYRTIREDGEYWEKTEYTAHAQFLLKVLGNIIKEFGPIRGLKMITDCYTQKNNNVLTAEILLFLATVEPDEEKAYGMILQAVKLRNRSAFKFLTTEAPSNDRQKKMCEKYREFCISALP
ncbi:MAG: hypothetical protein Hyperionvirus16_41 [Hyperionvirus sp.]|uniref:Uncharacterized protein n=1 Tax=Hyperionvirus sp. TaxID=2487770 RepID=A0A3G5A9X0_9VIRU|nr:MAG: hypothetical protein Hyperionvirus16_41 [Hyperionvirus sp.]